LIPRPKTTNKKETHMNKQLLRRARTTDAFSTYDRRTIDSAGAFLIGELERLDPTMHEPLVSVMWSRDIQLREDVSLADETSSFSNSTFAAVGGVNPNGKAWIGKNSNAISTVMLDIGKTAQPLTLWGMELSYTIPELESAQRLGRPVDSQKFEAIKLKHQMDIDEAVYIGDTFLGTTGLINNAGVTTTNVVANGSAHTTWALKLSDDSTGNVGPTQILTDVNTLLNATWAAAGWAVCPSELRIPPAQFALLVSQKVSTAGNISLLQYLKDNSLSNSINGKPLNIQPSKWLTGAGTSSHDRMMAYTNDKSRVRFPLVPLQRTPLEYRSIYQLTTYFGRLGIVEFVYKETAAYADGI
jgi:hypothetical protein